MGDGDVEDGIRNSCLSMLISSTVDFRLADVEVDRLESGGGVAMDNRRLFGGGPANDPFGLPNIIMPGSSSSED